MTPKTYNAKIAYTGSDSIEGTTGSVKVTVIKATPKITVKSAKYKLKAKTIKYTANFKNNKNQAIKNTKVTLKVKTYLKKKGSYTAVITVPANTYYNKVSKNVKITVKQ